MGTTLDWPAWLAKTDDLDQVTRAVEREKAIRAGMARTGEGREIVAEFLDAHTAMDEEGVMSLTDGEPTTLRDALSRYVADLATRDPHDYDRRADSEVAAELEMILGYPWPAEEEFLASHSANRSLALDIRRPGGGRVEVRLGGHLLVDTDFAPDQAADVAERIYRSVLARVIGDREHVIQLNAAQTADLRAWLARPNGSLTDGFNGRMTMDAVEGGGILVRTRPYSYERYLAEAQTSYRQTTA